MIGKKHDIVAPTHKELELVDQDAMDAYFKNKKFDVVIHSAVKPGHRAATDKSDQLSNNSLMFFNLVNNSDKWGKLIYLSSGMAYDMRFYVPKMKEEYFGEHIPVDESGLSKYMIGKFIERSDDMLDLRPFSVFGKYENYSIRFISNLICMALYDMPLTMNQNRKYDFIYIDDLVKTIDYFIENKAKHKAYVKRKYAKFQSFKVVMDDFLHRFVLEKIQARWSPEQMSGYLARQNIKVSTKAIYKFIRSRGLEYLLFWSWNNKKSGRKQYHYGQAPDGRKYIEERPGVNGPGHYEMDFIVSKQSTWVLLVVVDRLRKKTWVQRLPNRKRDTIRVALSRLFYGQPLKSITTDNDIAFGSWRELEAHLHTKIYFTHPYHSWEKGLVENTNRWIRCFVPKRRDIGSVTQEEMDQIHTFLNDRPRKCLGYFSANELLLV